MIGGAISSGILFRFRAAWVIAVIFAALSIIGTVNFARELVARHELLPQHWSSLAVYVVSTVLLLHPHTRAWVSHGKSHESV